MLSAPGGHRRLGPQTQAGQHHQHRAEISTPLGGFTSLKVANGGRPNEDSFVDATAPRASWDTKALKKTPNQPAGKDRRRTFGTLAEGGCERNVRFRLWFATRRAEQPRSRLPSSLVDARDPNSDPESGNRTEQNVETDVEKA